MPHHGGGPGYILGGPAILVFLLASLACVYLVALALSRHEALVLRAEQAARLLPQHRARYTLWGLSAALLVFAVAGILVHIHVLALLGFLLFLLGWAFLSVGLATASVQIGVSLAADPDAEFSLLGVFWRGLLVLLLASCIPFVGWLSVLCWLAAGTGSLLEGVLTHT